jgi:hypothetical protein
MFCCSFDGESSQKFQTKTRNQYDRSFPCCGTGVIRKNVAGPILKKIPSQMKHFLAETSINAANKQPHQRHLSLLSS